MAIQGVKKMRVCYILAYYSPEYIRTVTLIAALKKINGIELYEARNTSSGLLRYAQTLWRLCLIRLRYNPDCYILGFRGHEIFWVVRLLTWGKILIFDELMSPSDAIINDRKKVIGGVFSGYLLRLCEKAMLHTADFILTDTSLHKSFFSEQFSISASKIFVLPVSADEELFNQPVIQQIPTNDRLNILFYGSFLPLHGIEFILKAANILRDLPVQFTLVGGTFRDEKRLRNTVEEFELHNVNYVRWVDFSGLPKLIRECDLGLGGPFGNTAQSLRVITGKTFQYLAMGKAVVVGQIETTNGFVDKKNCFLIKQGDPQALANTVLWALQNREKLAKIGCEGRKLYEEQYSIALLVKGWREIFLKIIGE